ncbi:MAG: MBL fold metallo-hydrolase [Oscillospiraceae bacterium]|nr:MBL fold metallo-hydrolase [Oscillospiraceae bacterium]
MRATVVVDNIGTQDLRSEWGLCIYIEYGGKKILLDTGASALFAENADKLRLPLAEVDFAVLSHAHYDHANGMEEFFRRNAAAKFYLSACCAENCYSRKWRVFRRYVGLPRGVLARYGDRIVLADGPCSPAEGVHLLPHDGPIPEAVGKRDGLYAKRKGRMRPDDFTHEQSLVFEAEDGLVIFNSCSHGGADRIVREAQSAFPDRRVLALIGGFHLHNKSEREVCELAARLRETGAEQIVTGHCTGEKAYRLLRRELGERVRQMHAGMVMEF